MKRYEYVDVIKSISMVGVLLWHCMMFYANNPFWPFRAEYSSEVVIFISNFFDCSFVPLFVLASGFLFCNSSQIKNRKTSELIKGRVKKLLVPWLLYGLLWLVPTYTLLDIESFGRNKGASLLEGYKAMLLGQFADMAWFLLMLFWVSIIGVLLRYFLVKNRIWIGFFIAFGLVNIAHFALGNVDYYKLSQIDQYILYFYIGAILYCYIGKLESIETTKLGAVSIVFILVAVVLAQYAVGNFYLTLFTKTIDTLGLFVGSIAAYKAGVLNIQCIKRWVGWMSMHSMHVYLFQAPWIYINFMLLYPLTGRLTVVCVMSNFVIASIIVFIISQLVTGIKNRICFVK